MDAWLRDAPCACIRSQETDRCDRAVAEPEDRRRARGGAGGRGTGRSSFFNTRLRFLPNNPYRMCEKTSNEPRICSSDRGTSLRVDPVEARHVRPVQLPPAESARLGSGLGLGLFLLGSGLG